PSIREMARTGKGKREQFIMTVVTFVWSATVRSGQCPNQEGKAKEKEVLRVDYRARRLVWLLRLQQNMPLCVHSSSSGWSCSPSVVLSQALRAVNRRCQRPRGRNLARKGW